MSTKVLLIDNMNNNLFVLMRYLIDMGYDVTLMCLKDQQDMFNPANDTHSFDDYKDNIIQLDCSGPMDIVFKKKYLQKMLSGYDIYIGCGNAPLYMKVLNRSLDIYVPFGEDLYYRPFSRKMKRRYLLLEKLVTSYVNKHFQAQIKKSTVCTIAASTVYSEAAKRIGVTHYGISVPMVYTKETEELSQEKAAQSPVYEKFKQLRKEYDYITIMHSRQNWKDIPDHCNYKGNDYLIKGFAKYAKQTKKKVMLILLEYGTNLKESKALIKELGIEDNVTWFPKLPRKWILPVLKQCDFCCDQFKGIWLGGTGMECTAMGKPMFAYLEFSEEEYNREHLGKAFPPCLNSKDTDVIAGHLLKNETQPEEYDQLGKTAKEWFDRYQGIGLAKQYDYIIQCVLNNTTIDPEKIKEW